MSSTAKTFIIPADRQQETYENMAELARLSADDDIDLKNPTAVPQEISTADLMTMKPRKRAKVAVPAVDEQSYAEVVLRSERSLNAVYAALIARDINRDGAIDEGFLAERLVVTVGDATAPVAEDPPAASPSEIPDMGNFQDIYLNQRAGIFKVVTRAKTFFGTASPQGTGFVVFKTANPDGSFTYHLLTNSHVVDSPIDAMMGYGVRQETGYDIITHDGTRTISDAKLIGTDPLADLALMKFTSLTDFPVCTLADEPVTDLENILVVGNTLGLGITPNVGQVKNPRTGSGAYDFATFQHDASASHGNSGGPVFNARGEVVGVLFRGYDDAPISIAISADVVATSYENMKAHAADGGVVYGYWGAQFYPLEQYERDAILPEGLRDSGVAVENVFAGSPAAIAGLKAGDYILSINGKTEATDIISATDLYKIQSVVRASKKNESFTLKIARDGKVMNLTLKAAERRYGRLDVYKTDQSFSVSDLFDEFREVNGIPADWQGVVGIPAPFSSDIPAAAIITEVNGKPTPTVAEFIKVWESLPDDTAIIVEYRLSPINYYTDYQDGGVGSVYRTVFEP